MPSTMAHHRLTTSAVTSAVKYSPSASPITPCPALRSGAQLTVGARNTDAAAVASSGPSIQGRGVPSQTNSRAAASANSRVSAPRRQAFKPAS
jgi:hypothetical protein